MMLAGPGVRRLSRYRPPPSGPVVVRIPPLSGVQIAGGPTATAAIQYRWPRPYRLLAWMLLPRSGDPAAAGGLMLRMQDSFGTELVSDSQGFAQQSPFLPSLAATGPAPLNKLGGVTWAPLWAPLERVVEAGEQWTIQILNLNAGAVTPDLLFQLGAP